MSVDYKDPTYLEQCYVNLFAQLQTATFPGGLKLNRTTRNHEVPDQVPVADMPALILVPGPLHSEQKEFFGTSKWTFSALAAVYVRAEGTANPDPLPVTVANYIVWGLRAALEDTQPPYQKQQLGGLVEHAWIEGEVGVAASTEQIQITVPILMLGGPVG